MPLPNGRGSEGFDGRGGNRGLVVGGGGRGGVLSHRAAVSGEVTDVGHDNSMGWVGRMAGTTPGEAWGLTSVFRLGTGTARFQV